MLSSNEAIITLNKSLVPSAMRLNEAAGWNQTGQDWERVISLEPEGCFGLLHDGLLVSTTTAVCYGKELSWIGMVLTDPNFRGRGYARILMETALEFLRQRGLSWIKLDATPMGRPLYLKLGFVDEAPIERWMAQVPAEGCSCDLPAYEPDPALDREAFGACRANLLASLAAEEAISIPGEGFAMARPGSKAAYFGPCVSRTPEGARRFLKWFLGRHRAQTVAWDLLVENREAMKLAQEFGFEKRRELVRQVCPGPAASGSFERNDSYVFAIAGLEYG
jgi:GNAT superfamily N-acetyltransferase